MNHLLDIAAMILIPLLIVLIPIFIGQFYGIYISKRSKDIKETPVGTVVATAFGLLAFMLAFTFQIATNRYDARKELLLDEVTNIRTTYLRAGLLQEPFCTGTKELLVEYVDLRVELSKDTSKRTTALFRSQQILDTLWRYTERLAEQDRSSEVYALYTTSVNDLVDNFNQRVSMTFEYRIPPMVLWVLLIIAFFAMLTLGYHFGISGKGNLSVNLVLAFIFAMVMLLILALDRPEKGFAKLNQKPMLTLQRQLQAAQSTSQ
jgi:ABC-type multidrug transport system fused ATPase/permease subunit